MRRKVYKIYPINDSFEFTLKALCEFIKSEYEIENCINNLSRLSADNTQIGNPPYEPFHKPDFMFATLNFCSEKSWTNEGGYEYCEFKLKDKSKILMRWGLDLDGYSKYDEFNTKLIRKLKLDKLNLIYKENKKQYGNNSN